MKRPRQLKERRANRPLGNLAILKRRERPPVSMLSGGTRESAGIVSNDMASHSRAARQEWPQANRNGAKAIAADPHRIPRKIAQATASEELAGELLDDPDVLGRVEDAMKANGCVGDLTPALLAYVAVTSRVLERPINLAFVADPSAGKNAMIDAALALMPPEAYYEFSAASPTSIVYTHRHFKHRVVIFREADSIPDDGPAASAVRALAEDNKLRYEVTGINPKTGKFETRTIIKSGPTGLITTSMRVLRPQLNSRVLQVPMVDDVDATREVMRSKGKQAAGKGSQPARKEPFWALQRWLAARRPQQVIVPFGEVLADQMPGALELRMRRDFEKLLSCVKTIALLRQRHREMAAGGEIVATIEDYKTARVLLLASFEAAAAQGLTAATRETVEAIDTNERDVSEIELAKRLGLSKQAISWRVTRALDRKWLVNDGSPTRRPYRLRRGDKLPGRSSLPDESCVEYAFVGVPAPAMNGSFVDFTTTVTTKWPQGFTAAELAASRQAGLRTVRQHLDILVKAGLLVHDPATERYGLLFWVELAACG